MALCIAQVHAVSIKTDEETREIRNTFKIGFLTPSPSRIDGNFIGVKYYIMFRLSLSKYKICCNLLLVKPYIDRTY